MFGLVGEFETVITWGGIFDRKILLANGFDDVAKAVGLGTPSSDATVPHKGRWGIEIFVGIEENESTFVVGEAYVGLRV